jgi:hypothetical protein
MRWTVLPLQHSAYNSPLHYMLLVVEFEKLYSSAVCGLDNFAAWYNAIPKEQKQQAKITLAVHQDVASKVPAPKFANQGAVQFWVWHIGKLHDYMMKQLKLAQAAAKPASTVAGSQAALAVAAAAASHAMGFHPAAAAAAAAAAGTSPARSSLWSLTRAGAAAESAGLSRHQHTAPRADSLHNPKQRRTTSACHTTLIGNSSSSRTSGAQTPAAAAAGPAAVATPAANAPAPVRRTTAVATPAVLQQMPAGGHIPVADYLEAARQWLVSQQLTADCSKEVVQGIISRIAEIWQHMQQLHDDRLIFMSTHPKETNTAYSRQEGQDFTWSGYVLLLGLTPEGEQFKQQLGDFSSTDELTTQLRQLVQKKLGHAVCAMASQSEVDASFEEQHSEPLYKLRSVYTVSEGQGGGKKQQEHSAGCSTAAPCHGTLSRGIRRAVYDLKLMILLAYKVQQVQRSALPAAMQQLLQLLPVPQAAG